METLLIWYPKCGTCRNAKKWLDEHGIVVETRHIVEENPSKEELKQFWEWSSLPLKRFFNTSGMLYRELGLKDKIQEMSEEEMLSLLSSNGMLVKRPILVQKDKVLVGFKQEEWQKFFNMAK